MKLDQRVNALLAYDGVKRRLYNYVEDEGIVSYNLDGSNSTTFNVKNVQHFTVDGRNNVIYYSHSLHVRIWMYNMTSGENTAVDALSDVSSVKGLDMDMING